MLLVTEGLSEPIKDASILTPLLRRDDLTCPFEKANFRKKEITCEWTG
jgi:hypothetical protein